MTRTLERLIGERGKLQSLRCDNGPEFTSRHFLGWCEDYGITVVHIQPGKPMQNGHVESLNGRLRNECLNAIVRSDVVVRDQVRCHLSSLVIETER